MSKQGAVWLWFHSRQQSYGLAAKSYGMTSNESFYLRLKMNIRLIRDIRVQLNIRECFFEHESHESDESFSLRLKMNIRLREISVQLNIRECIFFEH